jgi:hypothetical protein
MFHLNWWIFPAITMFDVVTHQWCGFSGGHSGNKPASTVVPMVSYGMFIDRIHIYL